MGNHYMTKKGLVTMAKYKVFLSPSDQVRNTYATGGTAEDVQCGKIAIAAKAALERCGFDVMLVQYETMASKCAKSDAFGADLHVPIHSNAFDGRVSGTRIFYHSAGGKGHKAAKAIFARLGPITPGAPDFATPYPELYEVRVPKAPTAYIETDFHDVPSVAEWIIAHTTECGEAICHGICDYFGVPYVSAGDDTNDALQAEFERLLREHEKKLEDNDAGKWSEQARAWAIANGIVNGIGTLPDGSVNYAWEAHVTREQMVTMLHRFALATGLV